MKGNSYSADYKPLIFSGHNSKPYKQVAFSTNAVTCEFTFDSHYLHDYKNFVFPKLFDFKTPDFPFLLEHKIFVFHFLFFVRMSVFEHLLGVFAFDFGEFTKDFVNDFRYDVAN